MIILTTVICRVTTLASDNWSCGVLWSFRRRRPHTPPTTKALGGVGGLPWRLIWRRCMLLTIFYIGGSFEAVTSVCFPLTTLAVTPTGVRHRHRQIIMTFWLPAKHRFWQTGNRLWKNSVFTSLSKSDLQGHSRHWHWCHSIGHIWFPIHLPLQLCLYLAPFPRHHRLFPKI